MAPPADPLSPPDARKLIQAIVTSGRVIFTSHADRELTVDGVNRDQAFDVMKGGIVEPAEFERGSWRYRVRAQRIYLVVAFRSEQELVVVTGWRVK